MEREGKTYDDGAHRSAQRATRAVILDCGQVGVLVELDGLVSTVVAGHVALTAVDAQFLVDKGDDLLL